LVEELSYAETSFTYLITYFKDIFSFVVERQLNATNQKTSNNNISNNNNNNDNREGSRNPLPTQQSTDSGDRKNLGTTVFGKQLLELEKEICDLESELLSNEPMPMCSSSSSSPSLQTTTQNTETTTSPPTDTNSSIPTLSNHFVSQKSTSNSTTETSSVNITTTDTSSMEKCDSPITTTVKTASLLGDVLKTTTTSSKRHTSIPSIVINELPQMTNKLPTSPQGDTSLKKKEKRTPTASNVHFSKL
jgi:hypothetical protein